MTNLINRLQNQGGVIITPRPEVRITHFEAQGPNPGLDGADCVPAVEIHAQKARKRTGVNRVYPRLEGKISVCKFVQAIGLRIGNGKEASAKAEKVLSLFGFTNVTASTVKTALYDGSHAVTNKGGKNPQHKPAELSAELAEALDSAILMASN